MCEPVHNLTIEEILRDYSRGIVHPSHPAMFDDGDDVEEVDMMDDILDLQPDSLHSTIHKDPDPDPDLPSESSEIPPTTPEQLPRSFHLSDSHDVTQ